MMLRTLLGMSIGVAVGCGASAAPAGQAPLANVGAAAPAPASPCDLDWLERADRLVVTELAEVHSGIFAFHAELDVRAGALVGAARARYQPYPSSPSHSTSVSLRIPRPQVAAVLARIAHGVRAPDSRPSKQRVFVRRTGESRSIKLEAAARIGGVAYHALLETEQGTSEPQVWSLAGCERELSFEAKVRITKEYAELTQLVRRDQLDASLRKRTP